MMHSEFLQLFVLLLAALGALRLLRRPDARRIAWVPASGRQRDELWTFFREWLARPLSTAAFSPSSRYLNWQMVCAIPRGTRRVIELGAGTGALTRTLIEHGIAAEDLLAIELSPRLHRFLSQRFPGLTVVRGDARDLRGMPEAVAFAANRSVQAVVSGLGFLSMGREAQYSILSGAFALMPENGVFVQYTYGPTPPVAAEVIRQLGLRAQRRGFTLWNLPPASVYVFTREPGRGGAAQRYAAAAGKVESRVNFKVSRGSELDGVRPYRAMYTLRWLLVPLIALATVLALPTARHVKPTDPPAASGSVLTDQGCCHNGVEIACSETCPMGASIPSAARKAGADRRLAQCCTRAQPQLRSWASPPVTTPPKRSLA